MSAAARVLVVGGGIGGLSTTIALRRRGVEVDVVELNPQWDVYGVGILQPGNAIRALDQLGVADQAIAAGFAMDGDRFHTADGTLIADNEHPRVLGPDYPGLNGITRPRLHEILTGTVEQSGATVKLGVTVTELRQSGVGVEVELTDGSEAHYDLVVGADGIHSLVRPSASPRPEPQYTGQVVWRYNLPRPTAVDKLWMFAAATSRLVCPLSRTSCTCCHREAARRRAAAPGRGRSVQTIRERLARSAGSSPSTRAHHRRRASSTARSSRHRAGAVVPGPRRPDRRRRPRHDATLRAGCSEAIEDGIVLAEEITAHDAVAPALERFMERRFDRCPTIVEISMQIGRWEMERAPDADFVGLTMKSVMTTAAPI